VPRQLKEYYTAAEYLTYEREATEKHEYYDGEIFVMPRSNIHLVRIQGTFCIAWQTNSRVVPASPSVPTCA
jgi:hypothetical protein